MEAECIRKKGYGSIRYFYIIKRGIDAGGVELRLDDLSELFIYYSDQRYIRYFADESNGIILDGRILELC